METASFVKTLSRLDSLGAKAGPEAVVTLSILSLQTESEEWLAYLTRSVPFWVGSEQLGLNLRVTGVQRLPGADPDSPLFSIGLETDENQSTGVPPNSTSLKSALLSQNHKKIAFVISKPLELDDKTLALIKQKKKVLDPGSSFSMTAEADLGAWDPFSTTYLPADAEVTDNLSPDDLKALNLEGKPLSLCSEIRSDRPLVTLKDPAATLPRLMRTGGLRPKHDIKELLRDLVSTLKFLIPKLITDYVSSFDKSLHSSEDFKKMNVFTEQQKIQFITQRKLTYLTSFFSSKKFSVLQKHLQSLAHRFVYDKLVKSSCFRFDKTEVERNLNSLYVEVQMITSRIIQTYFQKYADEIPFELKYFDAYKAKENQTFAQFFADDPEDFFKRVKDYEKIGRWHMSALLLKQAAWKNDTDITSWFNLMVFFLRRQNFLLAESCFDRLEALDWTDKNRSFLQVCFLVKRGRFVQARQLVEKNLTADKFSVIDNLFMSFILENHFGRSKLAKKHFRVAKQKFTKTQAPIRPATTQMLSLAEKIDRPGQFSDEEVEADVWKELIGQASKFNFVRLVQQLLPKVESRPIFCNLTLANIAVTQGRYLESNDHFDAAIQALDGVPESANQVNEAVLNKACNCFFLKHYYEAETLFLTYFKHSTAKKNYFDVLLMLGQCYLNRRSFAEAEEVFFKLTSLRPKSAVVWTGLGIAAMHLGNLDRAEEALYFASKLETLDYEIVGQSILLFVKKHQGGPSQEEGIRKLWAILKGFEVDNLELMGQVRVALASLGDHTLDAEVDKSIAEWGKFVAERDAGIEGNIC